MKNIDLVVGLWKFRDTINLETLKTLAEKWAATDQNYYHIYIRRTDRHEWGIDFAYKLRPENTKEDSKAYRQMTSQILKQEFPEEFAGWDQAVPDIYVKLPR